MSSNIRIKRICLFCNQEFIAKTTVTKCCSDNCAKRLYKRNKKEEKIQNSDKETSRIIMKPITVLQEKDYLSVKEVSELTGASRWTISSLIVSGKLKSAKFGRRIIIRKKDLENTFK